jgi:hypothetical protein
VAGPDQDRGARVCGGLSRTVRPTGTDGRRWRATDPDIPADAAARPRGLLMRARRADGTEAERDARARVHTAKIALGERGTPWWKENPSERQRPWQYGLDTLGQEGSVFAVSSVPVRGTPCWTGPCIEIETMR